MSKTNVIVIAPSLHMSEYVCTEILGISPNNAMAARTASHTGLRGRKNPVVILYCSNFIELWQNDYLDTILGLLDICEATVIHLPEVMRVVR